MRSSRKALLLTLTPVLFLIPLATSGCGDNPVSAAEGSAYPQDQAAAKVPDTEEMSFRRGVPFADAEVFFEFNTTDNDLGFQVMLDAEGWREVKLSDPSQHKVVQVTAEGPLAELGITELRFESAEPSPAGVLALFPPGEYVFRAKTVEGQRLYSEAELSHDFVPPFTFSPSAGELVDPNNTVVTWDIDDADLVEIILEGQDSDNVFDVIVSGETTSLTVPAEFLEPDMEYKIELLAYAENGNRTIVESTFVTPP